MVFKSTLAYELDTDKKYKPYLHLDLHKIKLEQQLRYTNEYGTHFNVFYGDQAMLVRSSVLDHRFQMDGTILKLYFQDPQQNEFKRFCCILKNVVEKLVGKDVGDFTRDNCLKINYTPDVLIYLASPHLYNKAQIWLHFAVFVSKLTETVQIQPRLVSIKFGKAFSN